MRRIVRSLFIVLAALLAAPFSLLLSQWPASDLRAHEGGLDFGRLDMQPPASAAPLESWRAPDGERLGLRRYASGNPNAPLLVAIHGSGWHGLQFDGLGKRLAADGLADVLVPDLRGHGPNPSRRGDVDYIGQLEDDLAELIKRNVREGQRVILLGHSSGGGLVVRFAGGRHAQRLDGAVLLAPYLGDDPATTRPGSGGWAKTLDRRFIGLGMLNAAGITRFNGMTAVQFRFPAAILDGSLGHTTTRAYTFRMAVSYAPRLDLAADVKGLPPFLLVAGLQDEAFEARGYEPTLSASNPDGQYHLLDGVGHLDVVDAEGTYALLANWLVANRGREA